MEVDMFLFDMTSQKLSKIIGEIIPMCLFQFLELRLGILKNVKRIKKRYLDEFFQLTSKVNRADYFFDYQENKSINLWWHGKYPTIDVREKKKIGYIQYDTQFKDPSKIPLPILRTLVTELAKREKIKI